MAQILKEPLPLVQGKKELIPRLLSLSEGASKLWTHYADHIEKQIGPNGPLELIKGLANKLPEHAARMAGVLTLIHNIESLEIDTNHLAKAIELSDFYANEALRIYNQVRPDLILAQKLLDWLGRWGMKITISSPCPICINAVQARFETEIPRRG
jgi:hypothetical protein